MWQGQNGLSLKRMSITDPNARIPASLATPEFVLRPITAGDAAMDHDAVMETREQLRTWEQTSWPEDDFTVEANREDLIGLEQRHAEHRAYTYTVVDPDGSQSLGCVYVFSTSATFLTKARVTPLGSDDWAHVDAVVYFWVRRTRMETGMDERLLAALRDWFRDEWAVQTVVYVTSERFTQQADLLARTDLRLKFELVEPGKPGTYLVFG